MKIVSYSWTISDRRVTYDLLDDLAGRVEVDETLVDFELIAIPGLGTFTARLRRGCGNQWHSRQERPDDSQSYGW